MPATTVDADLARFTGAGYGTVYGPQVAGLHVGQRIGCCAPRELAGGGRRRGPLGGSRRPPHEPASSRSIRPDTGPMVRLILVRHAESEGNAGGIMQGGAEYPLSARGIDQARAGAATARALDPVLVVTSDLGRARHTAELLVGRVDRIDPRLRERGAGPWEGRLRADLEAAHPGALEDDARRPVGFEPLAAVTARMQAVAIELLADPCVSPMPIDADATVLAVTHGAVLRALELSLGGTGVRFGHLEGLVLGRDLTLTGRVQLLAS